MARRIKMPNGSEIVVAEKGESGNPNGRPKKSFALFNSMMREQGFKPLSKSDLIDAYATIFNADQETLDAIVNDKEQPLVLRIIIQELGKKNTRRLALKDFMEYAYGKAQERMDVTTNGESVNLTPMAFFSTEKKKGDSNK